MAAIHFFRYANRCSHKTDATTCFGKLLRSNAGCNNNRTDARLLATMLRERIERLTPWAPDDEATRRLNHFCELRRQLVNDRTRLVQKLTDRLRCCFPQALSWPHVRPFIALMMEMLRRWPDPRELKKADRRALVKVFNEHRLTNKKPQDGESLDSNSVCGVEDKNAL